jgi:hypothetical protein
MTFERGERFRSWNRVLHQVAGNEVPLLVVDGGLEESLADPLGDAAVDLALDQKGVDYPPAIVHGEETQDPDLAGLDVDLDDRDVGAERIGFPLGPKIRLRREFLAKRLGAFEFAKARPPSR